MNLMIRLVGFNKYLVVIFGDWRQVWSEDLDAHRRKLPRSPADQNNVEHQQRKLSFENMNESVKKHCKS